MRKIINFDLKTPNKPMGDQPQAIEKLVNGVEQGQKRLLLKGATGTGKTFTIANVINKLNRQTLIIAHNKTLVAQLWSELKELFPNNAVEYFVSYYDFYQPEAYLPQKDLFIEKESKINSEIERMRHSVMASLLKRTDVIVVASVSCLYPMSSPEDFSTTSFVLSVKPDGYFLFTYEQVLKNLIDNHYQRNDIDFQPGTFRIRGGTIDIYPKNIKDAIRLQFFGEELEEILRIHPTTEEILEYMEEVHIFSANTFTTTSSKISTAIPLIEKELYDQLAYLRSIDKFTEAARLEQRTRYDLELLRNTGHCMGIENYSRYMQGREKDSRCFNLYDYFQEGFLTIADESHVTLTQIQTMYKADQSRKKTLIDYGYRLPSSLDNRPPRLEEFEADIPTLVSMSATPSNYDLDRNEVIVEQIIRPTGLLDPIIEVISNDNFFNDLVHNIKQVIEKRERVLVIALTKKQAEEITNALLEKNIQTKYLHSDIENIERTDIISDLKKGTFDVLVGINLLREGLDLPEVSLVAVIGADQRGFLRSKNALIQIIGRASRNVNGRVILFADNETPNITEAIDETKSRRAKQIEFNKKNGISPTAIFKEQTVSLREVLGMERK
ncbi:excinuclease ABC subunit UvrB [Priestia koreensis]|uniref:excinuclease ABC subunit UvrB n=1 Tax=Priestia koreensis TaxID=284581 RepID=UPI003CFE980D